MPGNRKGGDSMARKKTLKELQAEREKAELPHSQRTHCLCTHGAMLGQ